MKVLIGIVTYNPDITRLVDNLSMICSQGDSLLIFDNGSKNHRDIMEKSVKYGAKVLSSVRNKGIAYGLKTIMRYAIKYQYDWVLSLDQDSVADPELIKEYKKYVQYPNVGAMTCIIKDRNFISLKEPSANVEEIQTCITSGCFMNVTAYARTVGYDERMFIDMVDFDICYSLIEKGFKIIKIPYLGLLHEVGHGRNIKLFGKKYIIYNQQTWRRFYIVRNDIYVARKHRKILSLSRVVLRQIRNIFIVFLFEDQKIKKLAWGVKGLIAGLLMPIDNDVHM